MKQKYRLFRRGWGTYYCEDSETHKQESLKTKVKAEAARIILAKNEAHYQPLMNLQIARAYMAAADPAVRSRTWQYVMDEMAKGKQGITKERWVRGVAQKPFDLESLSHSLTLSSLLSSNLSVCDVNEEGHVACSDIFVGASGERLGLSARDFPQKQYEPPPSTVEIAAAAKLCCQAGEHCQPAPGSLWGFDLYRPI
jgi:hypothetical protein